MDGKEVRKMRARLESPDWGPQVIELGWEYVSGPLNESMGECMVILRAVIPSEVRELTVEEFTRMEPLLEAIGREVQRVSLVRLDW